MNKLCLIGLATLISAACVTMEPTIPNTELVGLWQYPDRLVWVQIDNSGRVFQCRIDYSGNTFLSKGKFKETNIIEWERIWEPDTVRKENDILYLRGTFGDIRFKQAEEAMFEECKNPL